MRVGSAILLAVLSVLIFADGLAANDKERALQVSEFGKTKDGAVIYRYVLTNKKNFEAVVISYGASLVAVKAPDRTGKLADVVFGYDDVKQPCFGSGTCRMPLLQSFRFCGNGVCAAGAGPDDVCANAAGVEARTATTTASKSPYLSRIGFPSCRAPAQAPVKLINRDSTNCSPANVAAA